jgi:glutamate N-acetyltransferase / amino-acid N-acetyltransferase
MKEDYIVNNIEDKGITAAKGYKTAGISCGIRNGSKDLALIYSEHDTVVAGVFTKNIVQAAPVRLCRAHLLNPIRAVVVNSGNANACTGEQGRKDAALMAEKSASSLNLKQGQVLVCSTGVIGELLPMGKIIPGIEKISGMLAREDSDDLDAATAIMTTDTTVKRSACAVVLPDGGEFIIGGMAKGSGMICPNMATMLAFLTTDAGLEPALLQDLFAEAVDASFNAITVDGDTSTNDTALLLANGASGIAIDSESAALPYFREALNRVCLDLALQIVGDGEGITKLLKLSINGAQDQVGARIMARSILNSPLVKTAFYGEDANWGRIIAALGYAGVDFNPEQVDIFIGPYQVAKNGVAIPFSESNMKLYLAGHDLDILINLNQGQVEITAWGTDLSHEYININSNYRT